MSFFQLDLLREVAARGAMDLTLAAATTP